jgi:uncharacterized protein YecE (DUF72 family)
VSAPWLIGTAGWSVPKADHGRFPGEGTHLQRYARVLGAAEINSSFYRPHRPQTYAKWAASVPERFRFSVKLPKAITHERRLADCDALLGGFLAEVRGLGGKLGCLLVQLPPSFAFGATIAQAFFAALRARHEGPVAIEPRHATWFGDAATDMIRAHALSRVAADPACVPSAATPAGAADFVYFRLHGSPRVYYSSYDDALLDSVARQMDIASRTASAVWCIFDNTASGAAIVNALELRERLSTRTGGGAPRDG